MTDFESQNEQRRKLQIPLQGLGDDSTAGISTEEDKQLPYPALAPVVCFRLNQTTRPRNWCLKIACCPWLDMVSILIVLINCVKQALYDPCKGESPNQVILDHLVFVYFLVEMLVKMVALGVYGHSGSYLSNNWHKFDVFIMFAEMLDYLIPAFGATFSVSYAFKQMRLISREPSMRDFVSILLGTVPMLANVLLLYIFVIHVFAVVGVQLWAGDLRHRCFLGQDVPTMYNVSLSPYFTAMYGEKTAFICSPEGKSGMRHCRDVPPYRHNGTTCLLTPPNYSSAAPPVAAANTSTCINWNLYYNVCRAGDQNPNKGGLSFDNIGYAWITMFQVVTLEEWTTVMYYVMDSSSFWSFIFFVLITIMGSSIIMNVCAVVIATHFSEAMRRDTGEQQGGALSIKQLCCKLINFLKQIIINRHQNRVNNNDGQTETTASYILFWISLQKKLEKIVNTKVFRGTIMFAIFLSIATMAVEYHEQPMELTCTLQIINTILTAVFVVEMILKLGALSWMYFIDKENLFDFSVVIISLWETTTKADSQLSVVRAFRALRFLRLVHFLPYLKRQLLVLQRTIGKAATLCWLMLFYIFICSIIGMHLFGCKFGFKSKYGNIVVDRKNFDTLLWSMVTVFQILTEKDWSQVQQNAMATTSSWAALYFTAVIVFGKNVLFNVLVGIVVDSFQARPSVESDASMTSENVTPTDVTREEDPAGTAEDCSLPASEPSVSDATDPSHTEHSAATAPENNNGPLRRLLIWRQRVLHWCREHEEWSFFVLSPQNRFRKLCQRVISHKAFDIVILLFIVMSCITIAMERPSIDPESTERWALDTSYYVLSAVFLVEMIVKVLALGVVLGKDSYCKSFWNIMDGSLVFLSLVHILVRMATAGRNDMRGLLKVLRLLRTFRPLRVIKRIPKLKLAFQALISSIKPMGAIVLICCVFFFFCGVLGVQLFKGKFFHCVGDDIRNITNKTDCLSASYEWVQKEYNFDNLPQAVIALFVMYSKDGWVRIMYSGLDAVGIDKQPVRNYNTWMLLFFISFMIMSFLLLDMFIGVMVETFRQCQQMQMRADKDLSVEEMQTDTSVPEQEEEQYYIYYSPIRQRIHTLCTSKFLDVFMTIIIFISVLMMSFEHYNQPQHIKDLIEYSHWVFTIFLVIELLLKLVAFGVVRFIKVSWNILDVVVVLSSIVSIIFTELEFADTIPINPGILRVCRVLRLAQVLKTKTIRVLLKTIIRTLSQVGNICLLFMFFLYIYAALGVELFGKLECTSSCPCLGLHRHANFRHFGNALLTLYKVCTGDNWSGILKDTLTDCRPGGFSIIYMWWASPLYFTSFVVMAQFVLLNLVVAAVMQALEDSSEEEQLRVTRQASAFAEESARSRSCSSPD